MYQNCRRDFLHKLSKKLSEGYNAVVVENLNIKNIGKLILKYQENKKTEQELPEEFGKYIWLAKADASQEIPASKSGVH